MRVSSFFLADAAQDVAGKIYVIGGGWSFINATNPPPTVLHHLALVALLSISWTEANETFKFEVNLVSEDEQPVITEPLSGELLIGRPPHLPKGSDQLVPLVINFNDLAFESLGTYAFTLRVDGEEIARAPFHIIKPM